MPKRISLELEESIIKLYNNGVGTNTIAENLKLSRSTVQAALKRNSVSLRKKSPENRYNVNFFSLYSKEGAYWAGFIAADGYVRPNRDTLHIKLKLSDKSHLKKFSKAISNTGEIKTPRNKYASIDISGKWFVKDLRNKYGIVPNKALNLDFPDKAPDEYISHFLRGYFDGDGSVYVGKDGYLRISFTSGSKKLLRKLRAFFYDRLGIRLQSKNKYAPISGIFIGYSCTNAIKILRFIYSGSTPETRLDRKYKIYKGYLNG